MNDSALLMQVLNKILKEDIQVSEFVNKIVIDGSTDSNMVATIHQTITDGPSFAVGQVQSITFDCTEKNVAEALEEVATAQVQHFAKVSADQT